MVDPTGAWWGLRSSRDGKGPGFPILVLGGDRGDLPLPALGGAAVARLLAEQGVNLVADTSQLTVGERTRWFIDFAGTLYRLNRSPLHLVLDEAHNFAPQGKVPDPDTGKMLHAANTLASGGRSRGIRLVMITQRPQKLHKDALTSADTLIAMRVLAPHDRMAVEDWIKGCGDPAQGKEVLNSLAGLKRGEGWIWYPEGGHLTRAHFPHIRTFDSSATPTDGGTIAAPKGAAEIDLTEIRKALADAVKEAEANDPKRLRAKIAGLEGELAKALRVKAPSGMAMLQAGDPTIADALRRAEVTGRMAGRDDVLNSVVLVRGPLAEATDLLAKATAALGNCHSLPPLEPVGQAYAKRMPNDIQPPPRPRQESATSQVGNSGLRRILIALAQRPHGITRRSLGLRAGLSSQSGTFATYLSKARSEGWIEDVADKMRITPAGAAALGAYEPLPTGRALLAYWLGELGNSGAARLLQAIASEYPGGLSRDAAAQAANLSPASGTYATYISKLRGLELITGSGELRASEELFD